MVELEFNFIGVETVDIRRALRFYSEIIGIEPADSSSLESWALLVSGWDESSIADARSLRCELFEREDELSEKCRWECQQKLRPSIQVKNLHATIEALQERDVSFAGEIEETAWGQSIEFVTPGGIRWSLAHAPDFPAGRGLEIPHVGWAELEVADRNRQEQFYTQIMGSSVGDRHGSRVRLEQGAGDPQLFLEPGDKRLTGERTDGLPLRKHPVWMSFETPDINEATAWLNSHEVPLLQKITSHDWGGKDIVFADPEGNPIQVVEYLDH